MTASTTHPRRSSKPAASPAPQPDSQSATKPPCSRQKSLFDIPPLPTGIEGYCVVEKFETADGITISPSDVVELTAAGQKKTQPAQVVKILARGDSIWLDVIKLVFGAKGVVWQAGRYMLRVAGPGEGRLHRVRTMKRGRR